MQEKGLNFKKTQNLYICTYINQIREEINNPSRLIT